MTRTHIESLEERVKRLSATIGELDEEIGAARTRVSALETAVADPSRVQSIPRGGIPLSESDPHESAHNEATPAEVAEAIRTVEDEAEGDDSELCDDDILVV